MRTELAFKRNLHKMLVIKGLMLSSFTGGTTTPGEEGNWVERAMRISSLYRHMVKHTTEENAKEYIRSTLYRSRGYYLDIETISCLVLVGKNKNLIRKWGTLSHATLQEMLDHCLLLDRPNMDAIEVANSANIKYHLEPTHA